MSSNVNGLDPGGGVQPPPQQLSQEIFTHQGHDYQIVYEGSPGALLWTADKIRDLAVSHFEKGRTTPLTHQQGNQERELGGAFDASAPSFTVSRFDKHAEALVAQVLTNPLDPANKQSAIDGTLKDYRPLDTFSGIVEVQQNGSVKSYAVSWRPEETAEKSDCAQAGFLLKEGTGIKGSKARAVWYHPSEPKKTYATSGAVYQSDKFKEYATKQLEEEAKKMARNEALGPLNFADKAGRVEIDDETETGHLQIEPDEAGRLDIEVVGHSQITAPMMPYAQAALKTNDVVGHLLIEEEDKQKEERLLNPGT